MLARLSAPPVLLPSLNILARARAYWRSRSSSRLSSSAPSPGSSSSPGPSRPAAGRPPSEDGGPPWPASPLRSGATPSKGVGSDSTGVARTSARPPAPRAPGPASRRRILNWRGGWAATGSGPLPAGVAGGANADDTAGRVAGGASRGGVTAFGGVVRCRGAPASPRTSLPLSFRGMHDGGWVRRSAPSAGPSAAPSPSPGRGAVVNDNSERLRASAAWIARVGGTRARAIRGLRLPIVLKSTTARRPPSMSTALCSMW
mmetsp:Transcript_9354/g.26245  ORF Transcript_9354/g.26245 Transcript_9354/m.26245 type:complete len:259 (-) Transcript_9354:559-1335(-)